jgi:hypothetical protein
MIGPRNVAVPPEIAQLRAGQQTTCSVGIEFTSMSDRGGGLQAKFDIKFGSGSMPVDIRPSLGDIILPCKKTFSDFDKQLNVLQGFQRVESSVTVLWEGISESIVGAAALSVVRGDSSGTQLRFVGTLPASSDTVYVSVKQGTASHKLTVCSDNALAATSLMNVLKKAVS